MIQFKEGFKVVDLPSPYHSERMYCTHCGTEFFADQLVCARALKGFNKNYSYWYCPTWNCHGYVNHGVYFTSASTQTEG